MMIAVLQSKHLVWVTGFIVFACAVILMVLSRALVPRDNCTPSRAICAVALCLALIALPLCALESLYWCFRLWNWLPDDLPEIKYWLTRWLTSLFMTTGVASFAFFWLSRTRVPTSS